MNSTLLSSTVATAPTMTTVGRIPLTRNINASINPNMNSMSNVSTVQYGSTTTSRPVASTLAYNVKGRDTRDVRDKRDVRDVRDNRVDVRDRNVRGKISRSRSRSPPRGREGARRGSGQGGRLIFHAVFI